MSATTSTLRTGRLGHVGLNVTDLERSLAFYGGVLGLQVLHEGKEDGRRYALLGRDGRLTIALWQQADGAYAPALAGLHHLALEAATMDDVRAAEAELKRHGVDFAYEGVVPHGEGAPSGGIFFHDPDGTRLEIYAPTGAEGAAAPHATAPTCGFF
ncbi:VOC family protein [Streptomyces lavendulocolor]|uniref:VOC family protein n=1 Tax=Streptomyces lavendulocolor TaxID=67316 RepID=UPI003C2B87D3